MAWLTAKNQRMLALLGIGASGIGLTIMPTIFTYGIFGQVTTGLIFGILDLWAVYSLWKNKL